MIMQRRGLRDIHTLAGKADQIALPYKVYMHITCLEMERVRKNQEKKSACQRIAAIDARLLEVDVEKAALLKSVGERTVVSEGRKSTELKYAPQGSRKGFSIRY
jgi:hypothetical protein